MHSRLTLRAVFLAVTAVTLSSSSAFAGVSSHGRALDAEADVAAVSGISSITASDPLFSEKTKAVSGFAVGSLAGLLLGGRKRKNASPAR